MTALINRKLIRQFLVLVIAALTASSALAQEMGEGVILAVREPFELAVENVEGAVKIPLGQLRNRLSLRAAFPLCDARAAPERVRGEEHFRRHVVQDLCFVLFTRRNQIHGGPVFYVYWFRRSR